MSERPQAANSAQSRLRRPVGRLRDMPIWSKLGLIMIVPTIATIVVGTTGLIGHLQTLSGANRAHSLTLLSQASGALIDGLQEERTLAVRALGAKDDEKERPAKEAFLGAYREINVKVDESRSAYSGRRQSLSTPPESSRELLADIDRSLADLPAVRTKVINAAYRPNDAAQDYGVLIGKLLDMRDTAAQLAGDPGLSERARAAATIARAKEFLSQRRVIVHRALIQEKLTSTLRREYIGAEEGQRQALQSFNSVATRGESGLYDQTVSGPNQRKVENYSGLIAEKVDENVGRSLFTPDEWDSALRGSGEQYRTVEADLDKLAVARADKLRGGTQRQVFLETGLLLGILLLSILFAWIVARSMARSLRELRHGALTIAQYGLPQAVSRLRDPQVSAQLSPAQVARQVADPLPVRSKDEFGQVTEAFNAVHLEAVRTAAEQAALRASVATMFVNLARRSQILVDRLIGHLDRLERGEEDPDRLAELFQLDHLATRMRRNDENLLVLAGADSTRVQREPAALMDVLRAAQSEVEHYTRIEFGIIDRDIEVAAHAVNDLVHLVAELFDNATAFSPPDSQVMVEARRIGDRAALYVEDRGIGITPDQMYELNERLATPPQVDVAVSRMMGLVVVARLAARHGVVVELRSGSDRGTVAEVTLPTSVLVPRALAGRAQQPAALTGGTPASTNSFGSPLALEGGPQRQANSMPAVPGGGLGGRSGGPASNGGPSRTPVPGRAAPAWSDLTGASPANGSGGFAPRPRQGNDADPLPQRRSTDQWTVEGEVAEGPVPHAAAAERRPAGSDLPPRTAPTSAPPVASAPPAASSGWVVAVPSDSGPMPQSAPASRPVSGQPTQQQPVPGQSMRPQPPVMPPPVAQPVSGQPEYQGHQPPAPRQRTGEPGEPTRTGSVAGAPPAWPPVPQSEREAGAPPVPERLAAALDMTAELPRVMRQEAQRPSAPQPTSAAPAPSAPASAPPAAYAQSRPTPARPAPAAARQRFADETMELPIFRELESAWFRTRRPTGEEAAALAARGTTRPPTAPVVPVAPPAAPVAPTGPSQSAPTEQFAVMRDVAPEQPAGTTGDSSMYNAPRSTGPVLPSRAEAHHGVAASFGAGAAARRSGEPPVARPSEPPAGGWQTAADDGWRAAVAASEVSVSETTSTGLPKRRPMAQLVPGGVEKPSTSVQRRTPESVRGLLSAYHRGVQRGRSHPTDDPTTRPETSPVGRQSSQAGLGPTAGSGQKEHEG